jgi:3-deoxy-D-manno-octulosonate 8-phosphate phosphatase (KDO 8-P phosphatase)
LISSAFLAFNIGDDLNDYAAMALCGFKACPSDAAAEIREICDYVSPFNGGHGAVRDICEYVLMLDGKYGAFLKAFGVTSETG